MIKQIKIFYINLFNNKQTRFKNKIVLIKMMLVQIMKTILKDTNKIVMIKNNKKINIFMLIMKILIQMYKMILNN